MLHLHNWRLRRERPPHRRTSRRLAGLFCALAISFGGQLAAGVPAHAAVKCHGAACMGLDPVAEGCTTGYYEVIDEVSQGSAIDTQLVWSGDCDAYYATVTADPSNGTLLNQFASLFYLPAIGGTEDSYSDSFTGFTGPVATTKMVPVGYQVKSCWSDMDYHYDSAPETDADPIIGDAEDQGSSGMCTQWH